MSAEGIYRAFRSTCIWAMHSAWLLNGCVMTEGARKRCNGASVARNIGKCSPDGNGTVQRDGRPLDEL